MKPCFAILAGLIGAYSVLETIAGESPPEPAMRLSPKVEAIRLIRQDINGRKEAARPTQPDQTHAPETSEDVLKLPTVVVVEKKLPDLGPRPAETKIQEFFRTGTIWESRSGGVKLWIKGDKGLMLTFPF